MNARWRRAFLLVALAGLFACSEKEIPPAPDFEIELNAGEFDRLEAIVSVTLPRPLKDIRLLETTEGRRLPVAAQVQEGNPAVLFFRLEGETPRGATRTYHLFESKEAIFPKQFERIDQQGEFIEIRYRQHPVLRYNYGLVFPPEESEIDPIQARNAYIHPVWTPRMEVVTDDFHPDHAHQRGIWFAWTETEFDGRNPDFWNLAEDTGTVRFSGFEESFDGPVYSGFRARHEHLDLSDPGGQTVVLSEVWDVKVYAIGGRSDGYYMMDIRSRQQNVAASPLELLEYHYGGMAFRGRRNWSDEQIRVLNSEGESREAADGSRADWCFMEGPLENGYGGVVVMSHPNNVRSPQPVRVHPEMPYFVFSPVRLGAMELSPGEEPLESRYRYLIYDGSAPQTLIHAFWEDFASPPEVTIRPYEPRE